LLILKTEKYIRRFDPHCDMNENKHLAILKYDFSQAANAMKRTEIFLKLICYSFERPVVDFFIRRKLEDYFVPAEILNYVDLFLKNEGGMFKKYAYALCNCLSPKSIRNSSVLVPGVGYGNNMFQLAAWRPKKIVAFDLYEYKEEWDFLKEKIKEKFDVEVIFLKGGFEILDSDLINSFDFIITDGVWEHVKNLPEFLADSKKFLKNGGIYYASFGPLWWGPGGDHMSWGKKQYFNHVLFSGEEYVEEFNKRFKQGRIVEDYSEITFLVDQNLFSFLRVEDYLNDLKEAGFKKELCYAKISQDALYLMKENAKLIYPSNIDLPIRQ